MKTDLKEYESKMSKSKKFSQSTINELLEPKVPLFHPIKIFNISNRSFFSNKQVEIRGNSENDNDDYVINTRMSEKVIDKANTCKHGISNTGIMTNYDSRSLVNEDETLLLSLIDATSQKNQKKKKNFIEKRFYLFNGQCSFTKTET